VETSTVRVLPAMASRLMGLKIKQQLAAMPGVELVGEAFDAAQAVYQIQQGRPHIVLCDDRMLDQPEFSALFALGARKVPFKVVVVAANAVMTQHHDNIPVEAVVSIEISGEALLARMQAILGASRTRKAPPPVGMRDRFMVAQPNPLAATPNESNSTARFNSPANQVVRSLTTPPEVLTKPLDRSRTARRDEAVQAHISAVLGGEHQHRDSLTGLPGTDDLSHTLSALPAANHPLAILVMDVSFPAGPPPTEAEFYAALRSATAVLRTNVRHSDLVFHLEDIAFAVVLPGLDVSTSARALRRLRDAFDRFSQPNERRPQVLHVAMGIGFWEPGIPPAHPFQQAWQAMRADRDSAAH
jgi:DNA-binding NarL/FixJ family response regulator/GGDEF domain-containing protein